MNASKRKFNALIQGMGTRSTPPRIHDENDRHYNPTSTDPDPFTRPSPSTYSAGAAPAFPTPRAPSRDSPSPAAPMSSISADFLAKRRRLGAAAGVNTANKAVPLPTTPPPPQSTNVSNVRLKQYGSTGEVIRVDWRQDAPRYCPSDREQLIGRLASFQELTEWTPKPDRVSEIAWAKRGWVCHGKERVRCILCNKELVVNMNKREVDGKELPVVVGSDFEEGLIKKYAGLIIDAHQDDCLWRKHGCDDSLLRLPLSNAQTALPALRQRYDELCTRTPFLPYLFNLRLPSSLELHTIKLQLPPKFFTEPPPPSGAPSRINDVALALALTGWGGLTNPRIGQVPNSASCATCLRRLGLWMFKSKEVSEETGEIIVPAPMDHLDPVREHRFFCPWRNPDTQRNPGSRASELSKAAWEVLVQSVRNAAYLRGDKGTKDKRLGRQRSKSALIVRALSSTRSGHVPTPSEGAISPPAIVIGSDIVATDDEDLDEEDDEKTRDAKDKERWARLRRVKSLFHTKDKRRSLARSLTLSRPGTGKSTATNATNATNTTTAGDGA